MKISIYTDGACSGNPGPGGWAAIAVLSDGKEKYVCGNVAKATNNSMELRAAIEGLKAVKVPREVIIYTDSNYLVTCWAHEKDWLIAENRPNREMWFELIQAADKGGHTVKFVKVKGHSDNRLNSLADKYAKKECAKAKAKVK